MTDQRKESYKQRNGVSFKAGNGMSKQKLGLVVVGIQ